MPARRSSAARRSASRAPASSAETKKTSGRRLRDGPAGGLQDQGQPLLPHAEADAGRGRAAQRLHQPVVAPAAGHGRLRAERVAGELVGGADVVVEAAHQARVHLVGHARARRARPDRVEVRAAAVAEPVEQARRLGQHRLAARHLAVEDPQRVPLASAPGSRRRARRPARASQAAQVGEVGRPAGRRRPRVLSVEHGCDAEPPEAGRRAWRSARRRWPARRCRRPPRRSGGTAGSAPSAAARGGTSGPCRTTSAAPPRRRRARCRRGPCRPSPRGAAPASPRPCPRRRTSPC